VPKGSMCLNGLKLTRPRRHAVSSPHSRATYPCDASWNASDGLACYHHTFIPQVATAQFVRHNSIPDTYWGTWAPADATCEDADKSSITLSEHAYESSATSCVVKYVWRTPGPKGPTCSARLQCSDRGGQVQTETTANLIIRPSDADRIFMGAEFASLKLFQRCAKAASETSH
jgi:hypothetical protein